MRIILLVSSIALMLVFSGCGETPERPKGVRMDLCVRNDGKKDIFVVVHSGERYEDFGVVGASFSKTIGFGFGVVGETVKVEWTVDDLNGPKQNVTLALPDPTKGE